jgi:LmbE family N-acetylglucosaminyl deacetylase
MSAPRQLAVPHEVVDWSEATLVVAHPDDEVIFFSSIVKRVKRVLVCFGDNPLSPEIHERRRRALSEHPLRSMHWLDLPETGCVGTANWSKPVETKVGVRLVAGPRLRAVYAQSYHRLLDRLRDELAEATAVVTHNPWGEYGHEEHVQVCRVVRDLKPDLGFDLIHDDYCGTHNIKMALRYAGRLDELPGRFCTDMGIANEVSEAYKRNRCWTWFDGYRWPTHEGFLRLRDVPRTTSRTARLNVIGDCLPRRPTAPFVRLLAGLSRLRG